MPDPDFRVEGNDPEPAVTADAGNIVDPNVIELPQRKRGRPPGPGRGGKSGDGGAKSTPTQRAPSGKFVKKENAPALDIGLLTLITQTFGGWVAGVASRKDANLREIFALTSEEAGQIAEQLQNVGKHYDIPVSPVTQAWIGLGTVCGSIYAGKVAAARAVASIK